MLQGRNNVPYRSIEILIILFFVTVIVNGQFVPSKTWGFSYTPGFSKGRLPSGVSETFASPVYFTSNELFQFSNHASAFLRKSGKWFSHTKQVGASTYFYRDIFTYDPAYTGDRYLRGKRSFVFLEGGYKLGKEIKLGKVTLFPEVGFTANYLVYSFDKWEYQVQGIVQKSNQNLITKIDKFNYGYSVSIKTRVRMNKTFDLEIGPCYKHLLKEYRFPGDRVLFFYGLSLDVVHRAKL